MWQIVQIRLEFLLYQLRMELLSLKENLKFPFDGYKLSFLNDSLPSSRVNQKSWMENCLDFRMIKEKFLFVWNDSEIFLCPVFL